MAMFYRPPQKKVEYLTNYKMRESNSSKDKLVPKINHSYSSAVMQKGVVIAIHELAPQLKLDSAIS